LIKIIRSIIDWIYRDHRILTIIIAINIIGSLFGLYYYWDQLMMTPWYLWIFVPDCPLYTFLMIFALIFLVLGKRYDTFNAMTAVGLSMYGTWTMFVLLYFNEVYFSPANALMSTGLFVSHGGMALESVLLLPYLKSSKLVPWLIAGAWFLVQTFFDYFVPFTYNGLAMRLHPLAILENYYAGSTYFDVFSSKLNVVMYVTFAMCFIFIAMIYVLSKTWNMDVEHDIRAKKNVSN
jgi:uncharacterized membrane protein YpjA